MTDRATLFVYGTLQLGVVMEAVTGLRFEGTPAVLPGYRRRRVASRTYPAVCPCDGEKTEGVVFRDVDGETLERLDAFEGSLYRRLQLPVELKAEGRTEARADAWVYVLAPEFEDRLSDHLWDVDDFMLEHGEAFVEGCRRFRERGVE